MIDPVNVAVWDMLMLKQNSPETYSEETICARSMKDEQILSFTPEELLDRWVTYKVIKLYCSN